MVGAGAIGSLFGGLLARAGNEVWLVSRPGPHPDAIRAEGLRIVRPASASSEGESDEAPIPLNVTSDPGEAGEADLVIVAVKAYRTREAAGTAWALAGERGYVLTIQNGLGNAEALAEGGRSGRVLVGVTSHGATRPRPGVVVHAGAGPTVIGPWRGTPPEAAEMAAAALRGAGLDVERVGPEQVERALWTKLAVNAAINGPAALLRVPNGALVDRPSARALLRAAALEVAAVAGRRGSPVLDPDPAGRAEAVARATAANRCSMLQDVERGQPTEVEAIYGAVVREAGRLGVPVPVCSALYALLRALEEAAPGAAGAGSSGPQTGGEAPCTSA